MKQKYIVELSKEEREYAQEKVNDKKTSETFKKRAQILLAVDISIGKPETQLKISKRIGVSTPTIWNTVKMFHEEGIEAVLNFKKPNEPNKMPIVTGEREARIIAVSCGEPPKGYSRWTVRLLTEKIIELNICPEISRETVRRTLKKRN